MMWGRYPDIDTSPHKVKELLLSEIYQKYIHAAEPLDWSVALSTSAWTFGVNIAITKLKKL
jgi:hypothetical protein